ncbi:MAG: Mannosyl-oligosaccharide 1,2-alpha-mannosidase [Sphingomonas bacterium]|jgi:mannosyl-oligosaccharide alpha-1,2-mannosidase|nr:Mannosyl-oligosaccharide 1,2-alpha-mannosidase [Sphingomonas bacterium]
MIGRRTLLGTGAAALLAPPGSAAARIDWKALGEDVRAEMAWAWGQYRERAFGKDQICPISGGYESFPLKDRHLGLSLIEALDTLWVMGLDTAFAEGVAWVKSDLSFDVDGEVSVFETSIRLVGGLLSAHHACDDPVLLAKARDLADRLLPAFDTPTGLPYRYINLRTRAVRDPMTNPAEIGSYLPEWGTLSRLTGDARYRDAAKRAMVALFDRRSKVDLLADGIDALTGKWTSRRATVGPPSDSYYEYLWDGWQLLGDADCKRMYDFCTAAILAHQQDRRDGRLWFADVDFETGARLDTEQDELASFYGGLLGQGGAMAEGAAYTRSWAGVQDRYGVLPEGYDYASGAVTSKTNSLRPELADAAFNLWLIDRKPEWRMIGRDHYLAMKRWNRARYGYADLADVTASPKLQSDHCPGYWWSEQMKYYYLLFADTPRFDYARNYLSTEGNVLLGFRR